MPVFSSFRYLVDIIQGVIGHLVAAQAGMIPALPRHQDGERLDVLDRQFQDQGRGAEGVRVQIQEDQSAQLRRLLASQKAAVHFVHPQPAPAIPAHPAADQLLMVA